MHPPYSHCVLSTTYRMLTMLQPSLHCPCRALQLILVISSSQQSCTETRGVHTTVTSKTSQSLKASEAPYNIINMLNNQIRHQRADWTLKARQGAEPRTFHCEDVAEAIHQQAAVSLLFPLRLLLVMSCSPARTAPCLPAPCISAPCRKAL